MATGIGKTAETLADKIDQHADSAVRRAEDVIDRVATGAGDVAGMVREQAGEHLDRFEAAVRRNPLASTAIAAGVGFFLAALARR